MTTLSPPPGFGAPRRLSPPQPRQLSPPQPRQQSPPQTQVERPKRSMDKRVQWAIGETLCQVRLFLAEDSPVMSGYAQDQLQAKPTRNLHMFNPSISAPAAPSDAPPGFGGVPVKSQADYMALAAILPQISWRPPSVVRLDPTWHVMAGGASLETGLQKQRELRILEAVYPRPSSIPESPAEPIEAQEPYDDSRTPQIPLVPLEEEDFEDTNDITKLSSGPRFPAQGSPGQVAGLLTIAGGQPMSLANGRPAEKVKHYIGNNLPAPMQETSFQRKDLTWGNANFGSTTRLVDHSPPNVMGGRPPPAVATLPTKADHNSKQNGVQPDVAAAAAAAIAALSKSQEMGNMIDNDLLIQILSDPSLIHSLQAKFPSTVTSSKSELSSSMNQNGILRGPNSVKLNALLRGAPDSMNVNGVSRGASESMNLNGVSRGAPESMNLNGVSRGAPDSMNQNEVSRGPNSMNLNGVSRGPDSANQNGVSRLPDKINQGRVLNGAVGSANHWMSPPSTSYMTMPAAGGRDGNRSRTTESYINAGELFQRSQGNEERPSTLPSDAVTNGKLFTDPSNAGRGVLGGFGQLPRQSKSSEAPPPGFNSSKVTVNGIMPPGFATKSASQQLGAPPSLGAASARPLSRTDEQYFKSLIMQHGSANGEDTGRAAAAIDKGSNAGARPGNLYNTPDAKRWYGNREQLDVGRPERNGREPQDIERSGAGPAVAAGVDTAGRANKSRKVCMYFGTPRGCRNGNNCTFLHELSEPEKKTDRARSASATQLPFAKRLKVDG